MTIHIVDVPCSHNVAYTMKSIASSVTAVFFIYISLEMGMKRCLPRHKYTG